MRGELRGLTGGFIVKVDGMAESQWPEVTMVVFWPLEISINHDCPTGADGILDGIFGHTIVVVTPISTVSNSLAF
jgi:hypothetical protein